MISSDCIILLIIYIILYHITSCFAGKSLLRLQLLILVIQHIAQMVAAMYNRERQEVWRVNARWKTPGSINENCHGNPAFFLDRPFDLEIEGVAMP